jgi:hypothetical protein
MGPECEQLALPLPHARCLSREQAAAYLGIGVTLLLEIGPPPVRLGRRRVYDVVDLDAWLDDHKSRGRASKEKSLWPEKEASTDARTRRTGGSTASSPMAAEYAKALGFET